MSMLIRIRMRIQEGKPMQIHADQDTDPDQTFESQKIEFYMKNILNVDKRSKKHTYEGTKAFLEADNQVYLEMLAKFRAPGSGSAFPIRIRIQDSQKNADPGGSGSGSTSLEERVTDLYH